MKDLPEMTARSFSNSPAVLMTMILGVLSLPALAAQKTDIVTFKNGDKLTGELKLLKRGRLSFSTDAAGTISIEWHKIGHIESLQNIQVETYSGTRFFGHLEANEVDGVVIVNTGNGLHVLDQHDIISMTPIQDRGLGSFDVDLTVGYNFAKAGGVKQGNFGVAVDHRTVARIYRLTASSTINDSDTQVASRRSNLDLQYTHLYRNRWFVNANLNLVQNDEFGLKLRKSIGASGGRFLMQSSSMLLGVQAGLQLSREDLELVAEDVDSIEAFLSVDWEWFRFRAPELDWSTTLDVIPSLTQSGRVRANLNTRLRWEMINSLKWGISFYSSYDNQPQTVVASTSDYGVNTTLTYKF